MYRKIVILGCLVLGLLGAAAVGFFIIAMGEMPNLSIEQFSQISLEDINGQEHSLSEYAGKKVFLNFWTVENETSLSELPKLQKVYDGLDKNEYVLLTISSGQSRRDAKELAEQKGYTFPILLDKEGKLVRQLGLRQLPASFIIGNDGKVLLKALGPRDWTVQDLKILSN